MASQLLRRPQHLPLASSLDCRLRRYRIPHTKEKRARNGYLTRYSRNPLREVKDSNENKLSSSSKGNDKNTAAGGEQRSDWARGREPVNALLARPACNDGRKIEVDAD